MTAGRPPSAGTVDGALAIARLARLDAHLLLAHVLGCERTWLLAHGDSPLTDDALQRFLRLAGQRATGEPLAYLVGRREFHGLDLAVTPDVLVPRPDTEVLVERAIELAGSVPASGGVRRLVDLGTGSGAVALALRRALPRDTWDVTATDVSAPALAIARLNAERLGLPLQFARGDWWSAVPSERFDLAVANPPYVADGDPHLAALAHEPLGALASGPNGLDAIEAIVDGSPARLVAGGWLVLEHGHDQGDAVRAILQRAGYAELDTRRDLGGHERCTSGRWPGAPGHQRK